MSILGLCNRENRPKYLHKGFQYGVLVQCQLGRKRTIKYRQPIVECNFGLYGEGWGNATASLTDGETFLSIKRFGMEGKIDKDG